MTRAPKPWFAPKRFGYGAGLPISWQGWVLLAALFAGLVGAITLLDGTMRAVVVTGLVVATVIIAAAKTEGGWRWRSGSNP
ncbi:MAG: hypothetical protein EPO51_14825 [Phenylobacterium sp.]|uniref:hypothetical protein n=1 Tax=Phenylobacterium sp. TaxID=1871053 RepID=UPI001212DFEC|nr:hypothetical protein [Phenylobacterium sp.]TAJ71051.1 MAG: hypothetical protein EPO51_14825 [Phenylobacterium sp.]